jgi:GNAT superfamily N-acetyltransferase
MDISIRPYAETDLDRVVTLWLKSWTSTGVSAARTVSLGDLRRRLPREIAGGWEVHVASLGPEIVGFLALSGDRLDQLFISPRRQGQGIGKLLLDFVKARRPHGFWLTTAAETRAPRFYEREGLLRGETTRHPRFGHAMIRFDWRPKGGPGPSTDDFSSLGL